MPPKIFSRGNDNHDPENCLIINVRNLGFFSSERGIFLEKGDDCLRPFANGNRALPFQRSFTCCPEQLRYLGLPLAAGSSGPVARGGTFL